MPSLSPNPWCASWRDEPAVGQLGLRAVLRTIGDCATGRGSNPGPTDSQASDLETPQ